MYTCIDMHMFMCVCVYMNVYTTSSLVAPGGDGFALLEVRP